MLTRRWLGSIPQALNLIGKTDFLFRTSPLAYDRAGIEKASPSLAHLC